MTRMIAEFPIFVKPFLFFTIRPCVFFFSFSFSILKRNGIESVFCLPFSHSWRVPSQWKALYFGEALSHRRTHRNVGGASCIGR